MNRPISIDQIACDNIIYANKGADHHVAVYEGRYLGNKVAIKIYTSYNLDEHTLEINFMKKLSGQHKSMPVFYGSFITENSLYLVMEYFSNTLDNFISQQRSSRTLTEELTLRIYSQLIDAFAFLESVLIYHRDIKPQNIMITEMLDIKIIDFSISLELPELEDPAKTYNHPINGTQNYMSPELRSLKESGLHEADYNLALSDVFSLGIVLIRLSLLIKVSDLSINYERQAINEKIKEIQSPIQQTILKSMLSYTPSERKYFSELGGSLKILMFKFPVGKIYCLFQLSNFKVYRTLNQISYDYEANMFTSEKVMVKLCTSLAAEQVNRSKCLALKLMELSRKSDCFLDFYGAFIEDQYIYIVHEFCEFTLRYVLDQRSTYNIHLKENEALYYIQKLINGFTLCSELNIGHYNITSESIYINQGGYIKIANFTLPYWDQTSEFRQNNAVDSCIQEFLPPEAFVNGYRCVQAEKFDVFSLGLVCFEILTLQSVVRYQLNRNFQYIKDRTSSIPYTWARDLLNRMLQYQPSDRPRFQELKKMVNSIALA